MSEAAISGSHEVGMRGRGIAGARQLTAELTKADGTTEVVLWEASPPNAGRPKRTPRPAAAGATPAPPGGRPAAPVQLAVDAAWVCQALMLGGHTFAYVCATPRLPATVG